MVRRSSAIPIASPKIGQAAVEGHPECQAEESEWDGPRATLQRSKRVADVPSTEILE